MHFGEVCRSAPPINFHCYLKQPREYRGYLWLAMQEKRQALTPSVGRVSQSLTRNSGPQLPQTSNGNSNLHARYLEGHIS